MRTTSWPGRAIGAVLAAPLLLLTACAGQQTTKVAASGIVGDWRGSGGERISLAGNHTFTSQDLGKKSADCPAGANSGAWGFYVADGKDGSAVSDKATSGDWIGLSFKSDDTRDFPCFVDLAVVDGGKSLCETADPDDPCSIGVRLNREK